MYYNADVVITTVKTNAKNDRKLSERKSVYSTIYTPVSSVYSI